MLVITRKEDQRILINDTIEIVITSIDGNQVRIGIYAPDDVHVIRGELLEAAGINQNLE